MTTKLMLLISHPIQYYVPLYRQFTVNAEFDSLVVFRSRVGVDAYLDDGFGKEIKWDIPLLDGYQHIFLSKKNSNAGVEPSFFGQFLKVRPDVMILHGYDAPANMLYLTFAKLLGTRVLLRCDTRINSSNQRSAWYKRIAKRLIFKLADGLLTIGSLNRDYYLQYGADPAKIHFAPFCVDNRLFSAARSQRANARAAMGIGDDQVVILCVSKMIPWKRVGDAVAAARKLVDAGKNIVLVLVGSGECQQTLEQQAGPLAGSAIRFAGFKNQSEMPAMYAMADIFIFPSEEDPWGLALNEAMAAGLPAVISDGVGAAPDLVQQDQTGSIHPAGDIQALTDQLAILIDNPALRQQMGQKAQALINEWTIAACVDAMSRAVRAVTHRT